MDRPGWLDAHRGPFILLVDRPSTKAHKNAAGVYRTSEWLKGEVEKDDVVSEAESLLTDPRDTILGVSVWSIKEAQFVGGFRR